MQTFKLALLLAVLNIAALTYADSNSANEMLLQACMHGPDNSEGVKTALEKNADINVKDESSGQTCLMAATLRGKLNIVKHMLEQGADPSIGEAQGYTPPHGAAFQGRADVMQFLADSGLDVNKFHSDGFAPIHRTCWGKEERHTQTFQVLIDLGVDPNLPSMDGKKCRDMTRNQSILNLLNKLPTTEDL